MKYDEEITKKILKELEDHPNIRRAVKKVGIDHSTYYRWRDSHKEFREKTNKSLSIGTAIGTEILEGVLFNKAQQGDFASIKHWLAHNSKKYMSIDRLLFYNGGDISRNKKGFGMTSVSKENDDGMDFFEDWYEQMYKIETEDDFRTANVTMDFWLQQIWQKYPELRMVFYSTYDGWKKEKLKKESLDRLKKLSNEKNLPTDDSLDSQGGLRHQSEDGDV